MNINKLLILITLIFFSCRGTAAESDLAEARSLLKSGKAADAYKLLAPLEFKRAGDPSYDYLLGVAALDSDNFNAATLAFERVLAVNPNHTAARLDMARAYFSLGQHGRAKQEFEKVLALNPSPTERKTAEKFLATIAQLQKAVPHLTAYIEGGVGYDDNITRVTNNFTGAILSTFNVSGFLPTGNTIKREGAYFSLGGGLEYTYPVDQNFSLFVGLDGRQKLFFSEHHYNASTVDGRFGFNVARDKDAMRVTVNTQQFKQEGEAPGNPRPTLNTNMSAVTADWRHTLNANNQLSLLAQYNRIRYPDFSSNDLNQFTLGASLAHSIAIPLQPIVVAAIFHTDERAENTLTNGSDYSKDIWGFRLAGQITLSDKIDAYAAFGYQWRNDKKVSARKDGVVGKDELADISLGLVWKLDKDWSVRPQIAYGQNQSNIPVYAWNRTDYSIMVRKNFR